VTRPLRMGAALVGFGVLLSQLGHLLVYQLQFGPAAPAMQSNGAHAYFPALAKTSLGLAAAAVLASLLVIGASRLAAGVRMRPIAGGPSYVSLLGALFTIQLVVFGLQETVESMVAGSPIATAPHLLLMGSVGQLPVALLAALALKWLLVRFESAITELRVAILSIRMRISTAALVIYAWSHFDLALKPVACASLAKRGPPSSMRFSSN
jgi:glucan phosphoethanolaminetransferase (alkaline phosphatase superfamily)